ncbi:MAG: (2Fe-2S)-binding protein [Melioribacteraceae bacterium]|nr:MAG: (2Fe-2S)-binding protein [Melioribacteraceae bacterium]
MANFERVCALNELKEKQGRRVYVNDVDVAIFLVDGEVYAVNNVCPHQHAAMIYDGFVEDKKVACPIHGWEFDLKTGKLGGERRGLDCYEVKIENGDVFVKANQKTLNW